MTKKQWGVKLTNQTWQWPSLSPQRHVAVTISGAALDSYTEYGWLCGTWVKIIRTLSREWRSTEQREISKLLSHELNPEMQSIGACAPLLSCRGISEWDLPRGSHTSTHTHTHALFCEIKPVGLTNRPGILSEKCVNPLLPHRARLFSLTAL